MRAKILLHRTDQLGEGMTWLPRQERIAWVDILGRRFMTADPDGRHVREHIQETEIGAVLPSKDGRLILILRNEVVAFDEASGIGERVWSAEGIEPENNRFNDAAIDPAGNLWIGSMDFDAKAPTGNLYRVTPEGEASIQVSGFRCLNGPAFSPDGRTLYLGDTMNAVVLAFDLDLATGQLSSRRRFIDLRPYGGLSDGMTVDAMGNLWLCQVTASRIGCYGPDGTKSSAIGLPVPIVTSCCFGGAELTTLYATTARIILDDLDLAAFPDSGSLYYLSVDDGISGQSPNLFAL